MVASGWGVIAQVPLLQNLINQARSSTSQILSISIYDANRLADAEDFRFGKRAILYADCPNYEDLVYHDVESPVGMLNPRWDPATRADAEMSAFGMEDCLKMVIVSASSDIRHRIKNIVRSRRSSGLHLVELDYQPCEG
ncbi:hypothetical protein LTR70_009510 [Exophiala xenobiotica]|uniref:Uncharacterized protein n=1 Tax=Lithohypha guttulata TaxID=1690604 RepID=A0ABR0JXZ7_9EURO|nr:hypothetical protein LTR24_009420 [Lithohypha guttulata]KAK5310404.1 hypothetical protein LTR70_009510 [Exophiala xenobiotica]